MNFVEPVTRIYSIKKMFVKTSQSSKETNNARVFFYIYIELQASILEFYLKTDCDTCAFRGILRTYSEKHLGKAAFVLVS